MPNERFMRHYYGASGYVPPKTDTNMIKCAKVISLHWEERKEAVQEATLEVEHPNGDIQLFVISVIRMTDRISGEMKRDKRVDV